MKTLVLVVHILLALGVIVTVLLQSGKSAGLSGAISGGADVIFGKKKGIDETLSKISTAFAIGFIITSLALSIIK